MIKRKIQREKKVKRVFAILLAIIFLCLASCACHMEKNITVIVREESSGTREAFDKVISKNGISLKGNITKDTIIHGSGQDGADPGRQGHPAQSLSHQRDRPRRPQGQRSRQACGAAPAHQDEQHGCPDGHQGGHQAGH